MSQLLPKFLEKLSLRIHCVTTPTEICDQLPLTVRCVTSPAEVSLKTVSHTQLRHNSDRHLLRNHFSELTASQLRLKFLKQLSLSPHCVTTSRQI